MNHAIIQTEGLRFAYAEEGAVNPFVLDGVSLDIEEGSFVAVLGHNGSGKSTLAKHLNAILLPSGGKVYVDGIDTADEDKLLDIRRTVGMVFQNPDNQIVANVVEEDVAFAPENLGVPPAEIRRRVDDALKAVGMYEYREHAPHLLSGGQKQRVAIAGVIAMAPRCIALDEPTAMLDPIGRAEVMKTIRELNRSSGVTVVLITHHMDEAAQFVGLREDMLEKSPFELSGGQKRRVAIAGVIAMEPSVLILDEPTAGLDPVGVASILGNIHDYHTAKNATIIIVSHSMEEVARTVDRLVVINDGRIPFSGAPREVFAHGDELEAMGLGVPAMTRVFHRLRAMGVDIDPSVYTTEQARDAVLAKLARAGQQKQSASGERGAV